MEHEPHKLAGLTSTYRSEVLLALMGLPYKRIGELLGETEDAINVRLSRARKMLNPSGSKFHDFLIAMINEGEIAVSFDNPAALLRALVNGGKKPDRHWRTWLAREDGPRMRIAFCNHTVHSWALALVARHQASEPALETVLGVFEMSREDAEQSIANDTETVVLL